MNEGFGRVGFPRPRPARGPLPQRRKLSGRIRVHHDPTAARPQCPRPSRIIKKDYLFLINN